MICYARQVCKPCYWNINTLTLRLALTLKWLAIDQCIYIIVWRVCDGYVWWVQCICNISLSNYLIWKSSTKNFFHLWWKRTNFMCCFTFSSFLFLLHLRYHDRLHQWKINVLGDTGAKITKICSLTIFSSNVVQNTFVLHNYDSFTLCLRDSNYFSIFKIIAK